MTPPSSPAPRAPSRELDAEIAERVMGWTADQFRYHAVEREGNSPYYASFGMGDATLAEITAACAHYASRRFRPEVANVPEYSSDIAAAWLVVEKLGLSVVRSEDGWYAVKPEDIEHGTLRGTAFPMITLVSPEFQYPEPADTAPLAICLEALRLASPRAPLEGE